GGWGRGGPPGGRPRRGAGLRDRDRRATMRGRTSRHQGAATVADAVPLVDVRAAYLAQQAELDAAVAGVVRSGGFILGPEVEGFEAAFARFCGAARAVGG